MTLIIISILKNTINTTDSESENGGTLIYISKDHNANHRKDLESIIYKSKELESTFIEMVKTQQKECNNWLYLSPSQHGSY